MYLTALRQTLIAARMPWRQLVKVGPRFGTATAPRIDMKSS